MIRVILIYVRLICFWLMCFFGLVLIAGCDPKSTDPIRLIRHVQLPNGMPLVEYQLKNGLDVYLVENHQAPVFTFQAWYKVGSLHEKMDPQLQRTGLAHFFEHMMFRGTQRVSDGAFDRILTENGAHSENANTSVDRTVYFESMPSSQLDTVLDLESDRMQGLVVEETLLNTERGAVLGELHVDLDDPSSVALDGLYSIAYDSYHPYHYSVLGTEAEIRGFTAEDARYFYKKYYAPDNCVLMLVGDIDPAKTIQKIAHYYGSFAPGNAQQPLLPVPAMRTQEKRVQFEHPQLTLPLMKLGYIIPGTPGASDTTDDDLSAIQVLQSLLTQGNDSLLSRTWVDDGQALSVVSDVALMRQSTLFSIDADLNNVADADDLLDSLDSLFEKIQRGELSVSQVKRAKNQLLLLMQAQYEENASLATVMGEFIASTGDPLYSFRLVENIRRVGPADLQRVVSRYFQPSSRVIVFGVPPEQKISKTRIASI